MDHPVFILGAREIPEHLAEPPEEGEYGGQAAFGGVLQVDVVQMDVGAGWERALDIGGNVALELRGDLLRAEAEPRVGFDHRNAGDSANDAEAVGGDGG